MDGQNDFINLVNVLSLLIGAENLQENREQSRQNDVKTANDKQAQYLLEEINKRFDEQNQMLRKLLDLLDGDKSE